MEFDPKKMFVDWYEIDFGIRLYVARQRNWHQILGLVWGMPHKNQFLIYGSFVPTWARRKGIRTKINHQILEHHSTITSPEGSKDGGKAFMKAFGYKEHPAFGWIYTKKKTKKKNASKKLLSNNSRRRGKQQRPRRNRAQQAVLNHFRKQHKQSLRR